MSMNPPIVPQAVVPGQSGEEARQEAPGQEPAAASDDRTARRAGDRKAAGRGPELVRAPAAAERDEGATDAAGFDDPQELLARCTALLSEVDRLHQRWLGVSQEPQRIKKHLAYRLGRVLISHFNNPRR